MSAYWLALFIAIAAILCAVESYRFEKLRSLDKMSKEDSSPSAVDEESARSFYADLGPYRKQWEPEDS